MVHGGTSAGGIYLSRVNRNFALLSGSTLFGSLTCDVLHIFRSAVIIICEIGRKIYLRTIGPYSRYIALYPRSISYGREHTSMYHHHDRAVISNVGNRHGCRHDRKSWPWTVCRVLWSLLVTCRSILAVVIECIYILFPANFFSTETLDVTHACCLYTMLVGLTRSLSDCKRRSHICASIASVSRPMVRSRASRNRFVRATLRALIALIRSMSLSSETGEAWGKVHMIRYHG